MKFLNSKLNLKACPQCNHWLFKIICKSCGLETGEFIILDEAKLNWNNLKFVADDGSLGAINYSKE